MPTTQTSSPRHPKSLHGLPPLAGLCGWDAAFQPGLSVEESVGRLKRHHYALRRLLELFLSQIPGEAVYELKMAYSLHAHLSAEHANAIRTRVGEMREPPLGLDRIPHPGLEVFFDEIRSAPRAEWLLGVYDRALPLLVAGLERHRRETHPMADQPTVRLCRLAHLELAEVAAYGQQALACLVSPAERTAAAPFLARIDACLAAAGGLDGAAPACGEVPARVHAAQPFVFERTPRRDERFPDPYNMGVNAEAMLYDESKPADAKVLMLFYKRLREIDVPEMMASLITDTPGKPWGYYRDLTRQLWDEARHAMLGEIGFASLGLDDWPTLVCVNHTWSLSLNTQLGPKERHAVLYFIEQGLMPKQGKRFEWEVSVMAENPLARTVQDFDWADEVLHARIGRDWFVADMPSTQEAVAFGDRVWSGVLETWTRWGDEGLTEHRNWWPQFYQTYCERHGQSPDPATLAYCVSYAQTNKALKELTGSA